MCCVDEGCRVLEEEVRVIDEWLECVDGVVRDIIRVERLSRIIGIEKVWNVGRVNVVGVVVGGDGIMV